MAAKRPILLSPAPGITQKKDPTENADLHTGAQKIDTSQDQDADAAVHADLSAEAAAQLEQTGHFESGTSPVPHDGAGEAGDDAASDASGRPSGSAEEPNDDGSNDRGGSVTQFPVVTASEYIVTRDCRVSVGNVLASFKAGKIITQSTLIASLLAQKAPIIPLDQADRLIKCPHCLALFEKSLPVRS